MMPFLDACKSGNISSITEHLKINYSPIYFNAGIYEAAINNQCYALRILLTSDKADIHRYYVALIGAINNEHTYAIKILLQQYPIHQIPKIDNPLYNRLKQEHLLLILDIPLPQDLIIEIIKYI